MGVKHFIANLISQPVVGKCIGLFFKNVKYFGTTVSLKNPNLSNRTKALVFWNLYESAEARLISRHLPKSLPVLELGSSLGIISKLISDRIDANLVCVEANSRLIPSIEYNLKQHPNEKWKVINAGLSYSSAPIRFTGGLDNNLTGRVNEHEGDFISTITVRDILADYDITEYSLVCDIEGSEVEIFKLDKDSLKLCRIIIIELHATVFQGHPYTIDDLIKLVEESGFSILRRDGNCFAFERK
jgi:FkbM family methyltransferase